MGLVAAAEGEEDEVDWADCCEQPATSKMSAIAPRARFMRVASRRSRPSPVSGGCYEFRRVLAALSASAQRSRTRALHVAGTIAATTIVLGAIALRKPWLVGLGLVAGYGPAWFSHAFIEHNKPETFRSALCLAAR